jgi:CheY-like chemotaxis protein
VSKPVRQAELYDAIVGAINGPRASFADEPAGPAGATSHHAGVRVLVAEDNQINQLVISSLLERRGFDVDIAADGQEAVDKNARNHYAAIFMDCQMPQLDGYEATGEIRRRQSAQRHVPIIAMTAHTMKGDREKCLRAGMDDYIGKPVRSEALDQVLERILPGRDPLTASTAVVVR